MAVLPVPSFISSYHGPHLIDFWRLLLCRLDFIADSSYWICFWADMGN